MLPDSFVSRREFLVVTRKSAKTTEAKESPKIAKAAEAAASKTTASKNKTAEAENVAAKSAAKTVAKVAVAKAVVDKTEAAKSTISKTAAKATPAKKKTAAKSATKTAAKTVAKDVAKTAVKTAAAKSVAKTAAKAAVKTTAAKAVAKTAAKKIDAVEEKVEKKLVEAVVEKEQKAAAKTPAVIEEAKKTPAKETVVEEATTVETIAETIVEELAVEPAPAEKAPVSIEEVPAEEKPAEDKPAEEAPAEDKPAEETPVEEAPAEQQPETSDFSYVGGVLIAAAECAPLVKVGGLADVVGALPKYLKKLGIDARIIMPFHRQIKDKYADQVQHMCDFQASLGWRSQYVGLEKLEMDGTIYYFIDNEFYFGGPIYCGGEFEGEQYAFFTRAVMDAIPQLDFDVRILHCNDWHTAMMPLLAKTQYQGGMQAGLRTVLTIHNLFFQGQFSHEFDRDLLGVDDSLATPQFVEHYGCDNMLKAGIVFADKVTTVSPTYSQEICGPELGESLDGVLRSRGGDLWGILNGIDVDVWNPQTDPALPARYSAKSLWRKEKDREAVLEELGLEPAGENTPVIAMVGRLTPQKGIDLVQCVLEDIMAEDIRMIILGSGDAEYEGFLRDAENRHKGRLCSYIGYNGELSHRIYAGADLFLMPSLFEPCGISQMISMRYGTLPIVRETGGLKDTVAPYNEFTGEGTGFSFATYNAHEMLGVIRYALSVWRNPEVRKRLMTQAMEADFSFDRCARAYAELYKTL